MDQEYLIKRLKLIQQFYNDEFLVERIVGKLIAQLESEQLTIETKGV